jgi:hypothetical protein
MLGDTDFGFCTTNIITWQKDNTVSLQNSTKKIPMVAVVELKSNRRPSITPTSMVTEQIKNWLGANT